MSPILDNFVIIQILHYKSRKSTDIYNYFLQTEDSKKRCQKTPQTIQTNAILTTLTIKDTLQVILALAQEVTLTIIQTK